MKITYALLHAYGMGGTIRTVVNQANAMAGAGHDVEIVSLTRWRTAPQFPLDARVRVVPLVDKRAPSQAEDEPGVEVPFCEAAKERFTREVEDAFIGHLRGLGEGVLVTTRPGLNLLAARYAPGGLVRVAQEHMHLGRHQPELREAIVADYPRLDALVTLTRQDQAAYRDLLGGRIRIEQISNPLHTLDVPRTDHSAQVVVAAGRLTKQKGFDLLIPAFAEVVARHPGWRLRIYGSGRAEKRLRRLIDQAGLNDQVLLMGTSNRLDHELAQASIYALSSRFEGFGMVVLEALNCGLGTVSFDCPMGPGEIITDGADGLLVPPQDVGALAAGLCRLIEDEPLRRRLGAAGIGTAARYRADLVQARWQGLFEELALAKTTGEHRVITA